jgi:lipoprotein-anchoring transpeptidase ErfK/SrfK
MITAPWSEPEAVVKSKLFGKKNVNFDNVPIVKAVDGQIQQVTVVGPDGERVGGEMTRNGSAWQIDTSDLDFGTDYTVSVVAVDMRGNQTNAVDSFRTFVPENELVATTNITTGSSYGVGMPLIVTFNSPVENKAEIEERLNVETNTPNPIVGAWNWESDTQVTYRPKQYWPANTKVQLNADIKGVNAGNDFYALDNKREKFSIARKFVMIQDSASKQMKVKKNNKTIRVMPSSSGKPGYETRSGDKVIMSKEQHVVMDAASTGIAKDDPEYYRLDVYWAMRITWSGEYVHSAPWSVGSQGSSNVSHGCINLAPSNATWLFNQAKIGDPVEVKNTGRTQDLGNGWTMWEESWNDWKSGSALEA